MNSTQTQRDSYHSLTCKDLSTRQKQVMQAFKDDRACYSRRDLVAIVGLPINVICGRVNELMAGRKLVNRGTAKDPITCKVVEVLGLPVMRQKNLF